MIWNCGCQSALSILINSYQFLSIFIDLSIRKWQINIFSWVLPREYCNNAMATCFISFSLNNAIVTYLYTSQALYVHGFYCWDISRILRNRQIKSSIRVITIFSAQRILTWWNANRRTRIRLDKFAITAKKTLWFWCVNDWIFRLETVFIFT